MSEQDKNTADAGNNNSAPQGNERTFTQAELDRVVQERLAREREKFADHDELKAKAEKLAELEAANQSDLDKAIARAEAAEKSAADAEAARKAAEVQALRARIASDLKVPSKLVKYITGETQEEIEAAAADLAATPQPSGTQPGFVPSSGTGGTAPDPSVDAAERAKAWAGRQ